MYSNIQFQEGGRLGQEKRKSTVKWHLDTIEKPDALVGFTRKVTILKRLSQQKCIRKLVFSKLKADIINGNIKTGKLETTTMILF